MKKNRLLAFFLIIILIVFTVFLAKLMIKNNNSYDILHDEKFGGVYAKVSIDDFNIKGFDYGDSVDVIFSNGEKIIDIPYYNGYYSDFNEPLVVAYPGYDYIKICNNYGDDLWEKFDLTSNDTVKIIINTKKRYIRIQEARDIKYSDNQGKQTDVEFSNFRSVSMKNIKPNTLYRSASPIDNSHNRAPIVDKLIKEKKINYIVDLSDSDNEIKDHIAKSNFNSPYFLELYNTKKVIALDMTMQYEEKNFSEKIVQGLTALANNNGPYLIHCVEGKDRTGFVVMVLEALVGSKYEEMVDDYMETYKNYYSITLESDKEKYETIKEYNIDEMLRFITNTDEDEDLSKIDFSNKTEKYLLSIGMKKEDINKLKSKLSSL